MEAYLQSSIPCRREDLTNYMKDENQFANFCMVLDAIIVILHYLCDLGLTQIISLLQQLIQEEFSGGDDGTNTKLVSLPCTGDAELRVCFTYS